MSQSCSVSLLPMDRQLNQQLDRPFHRAEAAVAPQAAGVDWRLLAISTAGFCVFLSVYATQSILPLLSHAFNATPLSASLTVTATTIAVALAAPVVGLIAERFGRKQVITSAIFLLAIPTLLAGTATNLHMLIFWRFVQGLVMPGIIAVTMAYVSEEWPPDRVGAAMAAYISGNVLAGVIGRLLSGWIAARFGWHASFFVLGALDLVGGAVVLVGLPHGRTALPRRSVGTTLREMGGHFFNRQLLAAYAVGFNLLLTLVAAFTYVTFRLSAAPFDLGPTGLGLVFLVYIAGVFVTPMGGKLIDRRGQRHALLLALGISAAGALLSLAPSLVAVVIGLMLLSSGIFICQAAASSFMGLSAGRARASASGLYATFYYLGGAAGAFAPGLFWRFGGWPITVAFLLGIVAITAAVATCFWPARPLGYRAAA
ncbi:MAG: MFS transporter [Tepidisphaeraceae bacterium]